MTPRRPPGSGATGAARRQALLRACALLALVAPAAASQQRLRRPTALSLRAASSRDEPLSAGAGAAIHEGERTPRSSVRKPRTDDREYVHTTFTSGLRVLAVRDPEAKRVGFAVAVEAGSLEDPPEFQGMAHFCEHMLFLGSRKYPATDEFSKQLALFGGTHNAYTSSEETVYFNEIGSDGVERGLDIFAQFFISPSFAEQMVDKEIHAVDSEHKKNQPDTQRRLWHLMRSRGNASNPAHQFSTGDLQTLKLQPESQGLNLVEALRAFHRKNYCANRLHLVLVSNLSTSEQLELAHRHFDAIPVASPESCQPRPVYSEWPLYSKALGNLGRSFAAGTRGAPELWLMMPAPPLKQRYKELAEAYVWNVLGYYGPGSLKALLLEEDLSQSYSYYAENSVAGSVVFVKFALTEKGARTPETVLEYFFAYVNAVRQAGVNSKFLDGVRQLRQVEFDYQERRASEVEFASALAENLPSYSPEDVLTGGFLIDKPDEGLVRQLLEALVPSNMNLALVSPNFNESAAAHHEPYYDFRYDEAPLDAALLARLEEASGHGLAPPPDLAYVPRNLDLISESAGPDGPERLVEGGRVEGWWLGPGGVRLPKAVVYMKVGLPASATASVESVVLAAMHSRIVQLLLEQPSDALQTCGLTYSVSWKADGLAISFNGFDEHLSKLVGMVLPRIRAPGEEGTAVFERARRQLLLDLADVTKLQPYQHALEAFEVVTIRGRFSRAEMLGAARSPSLVNPGAYKQFLEQAFAAARLSVLIAGNVERARAAKLTEMAMQALQLSGSPAERMEEGYLQVVDPAAPLEVRIPNPIPGDPNSATLVTYQFGVPSLADRVHLAMLGEVIDRPVFEALRTERQLGYVVFGYVAPHSSIVEVRVLVQGFREAPDAVEAIIEDTVRNLTERIAALRPEEVAARRRSLRTELTTPPATLSQLVGEYWDQIWQGTHCFQKKALQLARLEAEEAAATANASAPAAGLLDAWRRTVAPDSGQAKKVSVKLFGAGAAGVPGAAGGAGGGGSDGSTTGPITLVSSAAVGARLQDEQYWPHHFLCE